MAVVSLPISVQSLPTPQIPIKSGLKGMHMNKPDLRRPSKIHHQAGTKGVMMHSQFCAVCTFADQDWSGSIERGCYKTLAQVVLILLFTGLDASFFPSFLLGFTYFSLNGDFSGWWHTNMDMFSFSLNPGGPQNEPVIYRMTFGASAESIILS